MGGVEQVVGHVQVIAVDGHRIATVQPPVRVVPLGNVEKLGRVGQRRIAHPQPYQAVALLYRVAADLRRLRNTRHASGLHAGAGTVERQPVVATLDHITLQAPHRQRQLTVRASILQGNHGTVRLAIQHDGFAKEDGRMQGLLHFGVPGGGVPGVSQEHGV
ncbi:hypothetical protein D3C72_1399150 [compost metagenome]